MKFEWDPRKAEANLRKHGVSFEEARGVFADPDAVTLPDVLHSAFEDRWITIGRIVRGTTVEIILTVVHVDRDGTLRVISARKASPRERDVYR